MNNARHPPADRPMCRPFLLALTLWLAFAAAAEAEELETQFLHPPDSARPWVYGFWVDGNISRDGLTADLEAMQRVGIGGLTLMDVTQSIPPGPVRFFGPEWRQMFRHLVTEAARLGLEVDMHNAPGWSGSGGPWITPALAMQKLVSSKTNLLGPSRFDGPLPPLPEVNGYSRAVATLAFPTLVGEGAPVPGFAPKISTSAKTGIDGAKLLDGDRATFVALPAPTSRRAQELRLEFAQPFTASRLRLTGTGRPQSFAGVLQASDDGRSFRDLRQFRSSAGELELEFLQTSARYFRLLFTEADPALKKIELSEVELTPVFRIELHQVKAGLGRGLRPRKPLAPVPGYGVIDPKTILDLTTQTDTAGRLKWDVPPGRWTVLHFGHTPTGRENHPARPGGQGLECDKLSQEAIEVHFTNFMGQLIQDVGGGARSALTAAHIDSWEIGYQNWTPKFLAEFQSRRGYDARPFLPACSGRIVGSPEVSERFLWDLRRTIADLLADNYAGHLAALAHAQGLKLSIEAYANGPFDELLYASRADIPMSEFWAEPGDSGWLDNSKWTAAAAHTYGKAIVAAEAFSAYPANASWQNHPFSFKALGDTFFCDGINRFVLHAYTHQPWRERQPGLTMGQWGPHYERTETWWEQSRAWHEYLARCQFLLQQGRFVADLCYLTDEGAYTSPPGRNSLQPPLPPGYDYDLATPEVVRTRMTVHDGRLRLPDGMSYRVLVLPPTDVMTPELLRKLSALAAAGATIVGPRPATSPSLTAYPQCDTEVGRLAAELWGDCDGKAVREHRVGKGRVVWGKALGTLLAELDAAPDFEQLTRVPGYALRRIHRQAEDNEIYFVSNSNAQPVRAECRFRVSGRPPELWHPDTGHIERPAVWHEANGGTVLPLSFDAAGSVFVMFRATATKAKPDSVVAVTRNGNVSPANEARLDADGKLKLLAFESGSYELRTASGRRLRAEVKDLPSPIGVEGRWEVHFPPNSGAPERVHLERLISWPDHPDPGVQYFSGTAAYLKTITVPPAWLGPGRRVYLDLGQVQVIAGLKINGRDQGTLWKPPFRADVTAALKAGENALEIRVVNLWPNRLIGDEHRPDDCQWRPGPDGFGLALVAWPQWLLEGKPSPTGRLTFATWKHYTRDSELLPAGLLGPVALNAAEEVEPQ